MEEAKAQRLEELYREERLRLERIATRRVGPAGAADVVHDVFAAIWSRAVGRAKITPAYLAQATKFTAISHFRSAHRRETFFQGITEDQYSASVTPPEQIVSDRQELRRLEDVILALPVRTRQVFLLNRMHGCTYEEIAVGLAISTSTVEREMARAIMACKKRG
ncbi:RNA polymerase sigma factor (plasmid) [Paracoccus denitrificans]|uniref:RNA polymerase sigma factor n=1 Tax=Paracoccus TaxID=265 RepID=UPI000A04BF3A|nr:MULTISPECIES: RNA polymerase sigma factor [Paracoccus]UFS68190.1 RNA polymerase sigma factor [Paracoccus denitrificans]